jgi:cytidyltransferase-like protein
VRVTEVPPSVGYAVGVFDLINVGHLDVLAAARRHCDRLVVGVLTDEWAERILGVRPVVPLREREQIVHRLRSVDATVVVGHTVPDDAADLVFHCPGDVLAEPEPLATAVLVELPPGRPTASPVLRAALDRTRSRSSVA